MCAIYIYIFLIFINGFIPLGEFNAKFKIISWIIISFILIWQNKNTNIKVLKKKFIILFTCGIIGFLIYIYPYLGLYNAEQIEDHLITILNYYFYIIAGFEYTNLFKDKLQNLDSKNSSDFIRVQNKLLSLQKINTIFCALILLILPYITKVIFFSEKYITNFLPGNEANGYIYENIDFTSISYLSLSINSVSRNHALLIPIIFIYIAYKYFKESVEYHRRFKFDRSNEKINSLIDGNKLYYSITSWLGIIYLLCSGSRLGIILGYLLTITFLAKFRYFFRKNYKFDITKISNQKKEHKNWDIRNIAISYFFLFVICVVPYNLFFPLSCREEFKHNTVLTNSTIPITHEIRKVISLGNNNEIKPYKTCKEYSYKNILYFSEFASSSFNNRYNLYTQNILGHESLVKDILFIIKLSILTIPLILLFSGIFLAYLIMYLLQYLTNKRIFKNYRTFNFIDDNFVPLIGSIYFLINSVISSGSAIAFGFIYLMPSIQILKNILRLIFYKLKDD
tara:strand:+ start:281 stop:1807 length:1527 start_codon:yes stop_codon:yes gene_type:complete